jgi:hypothetical protein
MPPSVQRVLTRRFQSFEYKSKRMLFGRPLLHVTSGIDPTTGRRRVARGFFAFGDIAIGVFAFGGYARGLVACGGMAIGCLSFGGFSLGLIRWAGLLWPCCSPWEAGVSALFPQAASLWAGMQREAWPQVCMLMVVPRMPW